MYTKRWDFFPLQSDDDCAVGSSRGQERKGGGLSLRCLYLQEVKGGRYTNKPKGKMPCCNLNRSLGRAFARRASFDAPAAVVCGIRLRFLFAPLSIVAHHPLLLFCSTGQFHSLALLGRQIINSLSLLLPPSFSSSSLLDSLTFHATHTIPPHHLPVSTTSSPFTSLPESAVDLSVKHWGRERG